MNIEPFIWILFALWGLSIVFNNQDRRKRDEDSGVNDPPLHDRFRYF